MAEQRYRFGGPIPESVQTLRERRRYRDSSLYAGVKRARREKWEEEQRISPDPWRPCAGSCEPALSRPAGCPPAA